jgi:hypothetical protein
MRGVTARSKRQRGEHPSIREKWDRMGASLQFCPAQFEVGVRLPALGKSSGMRNCACRPGLCETVAPTGAGGMGTACRAPDTRLGWGTLRTMCCRRQMPRGRRRTPRTPPGHQLRRTAGMGGSPAAAKSGRVAEEVGWDQGTTPAQRQCSVCAPCPRRPPASGAEERFICRATSMKAPTLPMKRRQLSGDFQIMLTKFNKPAGRS